MIIRIRKERLEEKEDVTARTRQWDWCRHESGISRKSSYICTSSDHTDYRRKIRQRRWD